jgi:uncharacterized membrane protein
MEPTSEAPTTELFGVPVWEPERLVLAALVVVFIVAVFVVLGLIERAENRRRATRHEAEQHLRTTRPIR